MGPEDSSLIGWVLVIVGIALTFIVYFIYINFFAEKKDDDGKTKDENIRPVSNDSSGNDPTIDEKNSSSSENGDAEPDLGEPSDTSSNGREEMEKESLESTPVKPEDQELIPIATILREADTGRMVLRINDEEFRSPAALKESDNWSRAERLQAEFSNWLNESGDPSGDNSRTKMEHTAARGKASEDQGMISQINRIIELKVSHMAGDQQSVRLVEEGSGSLKVLVGVETFPFDAVPYEEIRELIQESVAEWEAKQ